MRTSLFQMQSDTICIHEAENQEQWEPQHNAGKSLLTKRQSMLISEAAALDTEQAQNASATGYIAHFLTQATLPHKDPKSNYFERGTGKLKISIASGSKYGVPYGGLPRLLLAWICTEAVKTGSSELYLGRSQHDFLKKLDLRNDGKYISRIRNQCLRLVNSHISVSSTDGNALRFENILIARRGFVFWNAHDTENKVQWDSNLTLSTDFFASLMAAPVPLKFEVLQALKKSPMAMDIYTWLVYRMFTLRVATGRGGRSVAHVPWAGLRMQLGTGYANTPQGMRDFKKAFKSRLKEALIFYPEAGHCIKETSEHLILTPARLHIVKKPKKKD